MQIEKVVALLDNGLSIIPIKDSKKPMISWERNQREAMLGEQMKHYSQDSKFRGYGMVTGYGDVEVIDVDLKVLGDTHRGMFWEELSDRMAMVVEGFWDRVVIYRTQNDGFHIIYKCGGLSDGNKGLSKLKGNDRCILETRGVGGYVIMYDDKITDNGYQEIGYLSMEERDLLMEICRSYNGQEFPRIEVKEEVVTAWDDFNNQMDVMDIVVEDFEVVDEKVDMYVIKRFGAESSHSGYVYKDTRCMYLFSTGTMYPSEKLLSAFGMYAYKKCGGDFRAAAKELYRLGYGSRIVERPYKERIDINAEDMDFPLEVMPEFFSNYIKECSATLGSSVDYMGVSFLWMMSVIIGNSVAIKVKEGWVDTAVLWISIVGRAGVGKTPSIVNVIKPLLDINAQEIKKYKTKYHDFKEYERMDKGEKKGAEKVAEPIKTQFIANDITLESLVDLHEDSPNAIGVFKDELAGWYKDMNKYRAGSDMEFWLSSWSGRGVSMNRKSAKSSFVERPMISVIGGIQPGILEQFYTDDNMENGFVDRMLICYPEVQVEKYSERELSHDLVMMYYEYVSVMHKVIRDNIEGMEEIESQIVTFSEEAKVLWGQIFDEITQKQNDDNENEYVRNMLAKQKTYIPRFALLINMMDWMYDNEMGFKHIRRESLEKAYRLSKYFVAMSKKVRMESMNKDVIKQVAGKKGVSAKDKMMEIYMADPGVNRSECAKVLGVVRQTINNWIKEFEKGKKK